MRGAASVAGSRGSGPAIADRSSVLVADFVNTTGEPVFDGTLRTALAIQLEPSPYLSVFPEAEAHDTLRFMGRQPDDSITKNLGREICQRKGVNVLLAGVIAGLGAHYVITLEAITAATGDVIAQQQVEAVEPVGVRAGRHVAQA